MNIQNDIYDLAVIGAGPAGMMATPEEQRYDSTNKLSLHDMIKIRVK